MTIVDNASCSEFEYPECWKNDIRMGALFAPFRSKTINPTDWNSKMKFWTSLIESWCKHKKCPVINISSLKEDFSRKGMVPACLDDVLQNLSSTGVILCRENYIPTCETWKGWMVKVLLTNPMKWTLNTVRNVIVGKNGQSDSVYIHIPVVQFLGDNLMKQIPSSSKGKLLTFDEVKNIWKADDDDPENLLLVLRWLEKDGLLAFSDKNQEMLVKFSKNGVKPVKISETDLGINNLEKQQKVLQTNIKKLEGDRNAALEETKKHIAAKMQSLAKISLRRKKQIERTIEMRAVTLENIQALLQKIDQAKMDNEIVECYQTGIETLKRIFKETGLNEKNVSSTMEELEDVLNSHNNVEEALSRTLDSSMDKDLEDELNELLLDCLPDVPVENVNQVNVPEEKKKKKKENTDELKTKMEALTI